MSQICEKLRGNSHLTDLSLAFNPVDRNDELRELGSFLRNNESLKHVDLSGMLQTAKQVRRVVKKAKKARALLALHLSHTPCI